MVWHVRRTGSAGHVIQYCGPTRARCELISLSKEIFYTTAREQIAPGRCALCLQFFVFHQGAFHEPSLLYLHRQASANAGGERARRQPSIGQRAAAPCAKPCETAQSLINISPRLTHVM